MLTYAGLQILLPDEWNAIVSRHNGKFMKDADQFVAS